MYFFGGRWLSSEVAVSAAEPCALGSGDAASGFLEDHAADVVGEVVSPIFTLARTMPMVRMQRSIGLFCWAKTCSIPARSRERLALPRRLWGGIGRPCGLR